MFEGTPGISRRTIFAAVVLTLIGLGGLRGVPVQAAEEMNAGEKANLAAATAFLRGYNDETIDADKMAALFTEECSFRLSDNAPTEHGKAALIASIKKGAETGVRWDIQIMNSFSRGPVVTLSRSETGRAAGKPDRHATVVGLFIFKGDKINEWYDYAAR